ncbi:hypothetical protein [Tranquillimonas alkanivorans]|uniref:Uncharacterized protein n=1 Tax=Tranquillimonas alkanivorans TaxID=441119 RepID=A0A1I5TSP2_9RHOB|nr:hypothetical protein [Tranquillimonas alkanivorans]SFP86082.1 hypothetical protein SAMN04488047_1158 [Tranquillimonas alkanivorans]
MSFIRIQKQAFVAVLRHYLRLLLPSSVIALAGAWLYVATDVAGGATDTILAGLLLFFGVLVAALASLSSGNDVTSVFLRARGMSSHLPGLALICITTTFVFSVALSPALVASYPGGALLLAALALLNLMAALYIWIRRLAATEAKPAEKPDGAMLERIVLLQGWSRIRRGVSNITGPSLHCAFAAVFLVLAFDLRLFAVALAALASPSIAPFAYYGLSIAILPLVFLPAIAFFRSAITAGN